MKLAKTFNKMAQSTAKFTGNPLCFSLATAIVLVWAATGPFFGFSEVWQLVNRVAATRSRPSRPSQRCSAPAPSS